MAKSGVWGGLEKNITQEFGVNLESVPDSWYAYAVDWGFPYGTHIGVDVGMERETPIYAAAGGTVTAEGPNLQAFRPNPVTIETPDDPATPDDDRERHIYGHLWRDVVSPGQMVQKGDLIGYSGEQTKRGTWEPDGSGPHLHFERLDISEGRALDPMPLLNGNITPNGGAVVQVDPAKIDARIAKSAQANPGNPSPLTGMGATFVQLGSKYGVNPAVVVAILQRESQLGTDGSYLPTKLNNYGGVTDPGGHFYLDRKWKVYPSAAAGVEGVFQLLDTDLYRDTGGRLEDVMTLYSPPSENDWTSMWSIFRVVGQDLGVTIGPDTNLYAGATPGTSSGDGLIPWGAMVDGLVSATADGSRRVGLGLVGLVALLVGAVLVVPAIGSAHPAGRLVKVAKRATG